MKSVHKRGVAIAIASFATCFALPQPAQAAGFFSIPDQNDLWMLLLQKVFPGVGPLSGSATASSQAMAAAFGSFLAFLMAFAAVYISWGICYGLVSTAHEGKVMGERWHQVWAPVRVILGVGILTPVVNGYCLAQILVVYVSVWGGSMGNTLWAAYVDALATPTFENARLPQTVDLARNTLEVEVCWSAVAKMEAKAAATRSGFGSLVAPANVVPASHPAPTISFTTADVSANLATSYSEFGNISSLDFNGPMVGVRQHMTWDYGSCGQINVDVASTGYDQLMLADFQVFLGSVSAAADRISDVVVTTNTVVDQNTVNAAINDVLAARRTLDSSLVADAEAAKPLSTGQQMANFKAEAVRGGWVTAGSYYMTLSRIQSQWLEQMNNLPGVSFGSSSGIKNPELVRMLVGGHDGNLSTGSGLLGRLGDAWISAAGSNGGTGTMSADPALTASPDDSWSVQAIFNWLWLKTGFTAKILGWLNVSSQTGGALGHMMNLGYILLDVFWVIAGVAFGAALLGKFVGISALGKVAGVGGGGGLVGGALSFLTSLAIGLLSAAVVHAYVLPMIPYVLFLFFIMGMLVLVAEGFVAACLFALFHVSLGGRDLFEREQMAGYMILFNLLTRIPLAMLGLFLSLAVFEAMVGLMSVTFYPAVVAAMGSGGAGLVDMVVMVVIMTYLHYQLAIRSFSLITHVPDRVQRWFGGQGEGHGEEDHARGHTAFVVGNIQSTSGNIPKVMAGGGGVRRLPGGGGDISKVPTRGSRPSE